MMADQVFENITKQDIGRAPLQQQIISIGILLDKAAQLEKAQTLNLETEIIKPSEHLNGEEG